MPDSDYIFESGEAISVGSHGEHDFVYASGKEVTDTGQSEYVYEAGTGLGGGSLVVDGTTVGFYETDDTPSEWLDYTEQNVDTNAQGWLADGYETSPGSYAFYFFGALSNATGNYMLAIWCVNTQDTTTNVGWDSRWNGFGDIAINPGVPDAQDGEDHDDFGTNSNGDPITGNRHGWDNGDGWAWEFPPGSSATIEVDILQFRSISDADAGDFTDSTDPQTVIGHGPQGSTSRSFQGYGSDTTTIEVNV